MSKFQVKLEDTFQAVELGEFETIEEAIQWANDKYPDWVELYDGEVGATNVKPEPITITSQVLSEIFYTVDTYSTFSIDLLDDYWVDESEFDNEGFMVGLGELHADTINNELPHGPVRSVECVGTTSPREYNFRTDRAILNIEIEEVELRKYGEDNLGELEVFLKERFTSCDGFWSFVPNNTKEFFGAIDRTSKEYDSESDRETCLAILAGWYLTREVLTVDEYMDTMYDGMHELMWEYFTQFTDETYDEYSKYAEQFEEKNEYPLDPEQWYREFKEEK